MTTLRRWTPAEDDVLRAAWERRRLRDVAAELGRRESEVSVRCRRIGLRVRGERWRSQRGFAPDHGRAVRRYERRGSGKPQRVMEHRAVAEEKLGRELLPTDIVHHIDLDRANNDAANLDVLDGRAAHMRAHRSLDALVPSLLAAGVIAYADGRYVMAQT